MLFLDPAAMYFSTYVPNLLPDLYAPHLCQPNVLSSDGSVSLSTVSYSRNGKWFAYALSRSVRHLFAVTVQGNIVSVGKRLHKHLHSLH
jgi:hypothetical protein